MAARRLAHPPGLHLFGSERALDVPQFRISADGVRAAAEHELPLLRPAVPQDVRPRVDRHQSADTSG
eukprot:15742496-Heterocapsa_arctica.AAC.1